MYMNTCTPQCLQFLQYGIQQSPCYLVNCLHIALVFRIFIIGMIAMADCCSLYSSLLYLHKGPQIKLYRFSSFYNGTIIMVKCILSQCTHEHMLSLFFMHIVHILAIPLSSLSIFLMIPSIYCGLEPLSIPIEADSSIISSSTLMLPLPSSSNNPNNS